MTWLPEQDGHHHHDADAHEYYDDGADDSHEGSSYCNLAINFPKARASQLIDCADLTGVQPSLIRESSFPSPGERFAQRLTKLKKNFMMFSISCRFSLICSILRTSPTHSLH